MILNIQLVRDRLLSIYMFCGKREATEIAKHKEAYDGLVEEFAIIKELTNQIINI